MLTYKMTTSDYQKILLNAYFCRLFMLNLTAVIKLRWEKALAVTPIAASVCNAFYLISKLLIELICQKRRTLM